MTLAQGIASQLSGLTPEEREAFALDSVGTIADEETRRVVLPLVSEQLRFMNAREKADTALRISDFAANVRKQNLDPLSAIKTLKDYGISGEESGAAMERAFGKIAESPANRAALDDLRLRIDRGEVTSKSQIEVFGMNFRMTDAQINAARSYLEQGGKLKGASFTTVESLYKKLTKKSSMPEGFYDAVASFLPNGKTPSEQELKKVISNLVMDGRIRDAWFGGDTLFEAFQNKESAGWLPSLTADERKKISSVLREKGVPFKERDMQEFKKAFMMGIPLAQEEK